VSLAAADKINARKIKTSLIRVGICLDQMMQSLLEYAVARRSVLLH
jgi:hypothetical protein